MGSGISIVAGPKPLAQGRTLLKKTFTGLDVRIPLASAAVAGIDVELKLRGTIEVKATDLNVSAGLRLIDRNGRLELEEEGTFVRVNLDGSAKLTVEGSASLGVSVTLTPPPGLSDKEKKELEDLRLKVIELTAKGELTATFGPLRTVLVTNWGVIGPVTSKLNYNFHRSDAVLNGGLKLWYDVCVLSNSLRKTLGMNECPNPAAAPDYDKPFGPISLVGKNLTKPSIHDPGSFSSSGNGMGAGIGSGGSGTATQFGGAVFGAMASAPLPPDQPRGTLRFSFASCGWKGGRGWTAGG